MAISRRAAVGCLTALAAGAIILFIALTGSNDPQVVVQAVDLIVGALQVQLCLFSICFCIAVLRDITYLHVYRMLCCMIMIVELIAELNATPSFLLVSRCAVAVLLCQLVAIRIRYTTAEIRMSNRRQMSADDAVCGASKRAGEGEGELNSVFIHICALQESGLANKEKEY